MKVFVAGASGAIGRPLVTALAAAKHEVVGMTSRSKGVKLLRERGAEGVLLNALDAGAVSAAMARIRPDAILDELTSLPGAIPPRRCGRPLRATAPTVLIQPMAGDDVASALVEIATASPVNQTVEIGGPEQFRLDELARRDLTALHDSREVITDPQAGYYGIRVGERTLVPGTGALLGKTRFEDWLVEAAKPLGKAGR